MIERVSEDVFIQGGLPPEIESGAEGT